MKKFENKSVIGYNGKAILVKSESGEHELTLKEVFQILLNNAPLKTQQDSINGMRLQMALDKCGDLIELEEGVHDWLKPIAEQLTPMIFKINGNLVYKLIQEGFIK